jgi:hypothetical protein
MKNFSRRIAYQNGCTGLKSRKLIHKVDKEQLIERESRQFGYRLNFSNEILVSINIFGKPLNSIKEGFGDWQCVEVLHEFR